MPDEPVAPDRPVLARHQLHQLLLDFFRIRLAGKAQPMGKPHDVCIDDDALVFVESIPEHHICSLPSDAR
jgi:hypothetical protein